MVGGLCENNDKFAIDRMLPKIDIGDLIYIHDTGAHGSAMGYNYNGKLRSAEVLLCEDGSHRLIRRAETPPRLLCNAGLPARHEAPVRGLRRLSPPENLRGVICFLDSSLPAA